MTSTDAPRSTNREDFQVVPRAVGAMAKDFPDGHVIPAHHHPRAQLIYAAAGVMRVATGDASWILPPLRGLWMPPWLGHEVRMTGAVAMRTLYVREDAAAALPRAVRVIAVAPLLRELILRATAMPLLYDEAGPEGRVIALILDEIAAAPPLALGLRRPRDPRLARLCAALDADPADRRTLARWATAVGASERTLARLFHAETGMGFATWRQQLRLQEALARLALGAPVTAVALDLGYESPSAFAAMVRRATGASPRALRAGAGDRIASR